MIKIKLNEIMENKGGTLEELAAVTGIKASILQKMCEQKALTLQVRALNILCKELKCNVSDLIEYVDE